MSENQALILIGVAILSHSLSLAYRLSRERKRTAELEQILKRNHIFGITAAYRITPDQVKAARAFDPEAGGEK